MWRLLMSQLLLLSLAGFSIQAWSSAGRVLNFSGDVLVNGQPLTEDAVLTSNDVIVTGADGLVMIVLADNSVLDIVEESEIVIRDYVYDASSPEDNTSDVEVVEGTLRYVSGLMAKEDPSDISIRAGSSTIGVRGTFAIITKSGGVVAVEAHIGAVYTSFESASRGGVMTSYDVGTGEALEVNLYDGAPPAITEATMNRVSSAVAAIASAAQAGATSADIQAVLQGSGIAADPEALALAVVVLNNNAESFGIEPDAVAPIVATTVGAVAVVNPGAAAAAVVVATVVNTPPASSGEPAPDNSIFVDAVQDAVEEAVENGDLSESEAAEVGTAEELSDLVEKAEVISQDAAADPDVSTGAGNVESDVVVESESEEPPDGGLPDGQSPQ
jgi:FecR-like protein